MPRFCRSCFILFFLFHATPGFSAEKKVVLLGPGYVQGLRLSKDQRLDTLLQLQFQTYRPHLKLTIINEGAQGGIPSYYKKRIGEVLSKHRPQYVVMFVGMGSVFVGEYVAEMGVSPTCPIFNWLFDRADYSQKIMAVSSSHLKSINAQVLQADAKLVLVFVTSKVDVEEFRKQTPFCRFFAKLFRFEGLSGDGVYGALTDLGIPIVYPKLAVQRAYDLSPVEYLNREFSPEATSHFAMDLMPWLIPELSSD